MMSRTKSKLKACVFVSHFEGPAWQYFDHRKFNPSKLGALTFTFISDLVFFSLANHHKLYSVDVVFYSYSYGVTGIWLAIESQ
jgi:hypothetical protein